MWHWVREGRVGGYLVLCVVHVLGLDRFGFPFGQEDVLGRAVRIGEGGAL